MNIFLRQSNISVWGVDFSLFDSATIKKQSIHLYKRGKLKNEQVHVNTKGKKIRKIHFLI